VWIIAAILLFAYFAVRIAHAIKTDPEGYRQFLLGRILLMALIIGVAFLASRL